LKDSKSLLSRSFKIKFLYRPSPRLLLTNCAILWGALQATLNHGVDIVRVAKICAYLKA
jgi:hypothetical protein